jgi:ABC-type branched-subunit amino acid transport system ATPase component
MLELRGLSTGYGGTPVVHDIDLMVGAGEIVTLVGANGAGKTTLVKTIGLLRAESGQILFDGKRIEALSPRGRTFIISTNLIPQVERFPRLSIGRRKGHPREGLFLPPRALKRARKVPKPLPGRDGECVQS